MRVLIAIIVFLIIALAEFYFIQAVKTVTIDISPSKRKIILYITYSLTIITLLFAVTAMLYPPPEWNQFFRTMAFVFLIISISKIFCVVFLLIDDGIRLVKWISHFFKEKEPIVNELQEGAQKISRIKFLSQMALVFTVIPAVSFIYGMIKGAYQFKVHKAKVSSPNLPEAFHGFKIAQISDIHCGSFMSTEPLETAFKILLDQKPDIIFFTGDLVNNEAIETEPHLNSYKMLKAPFGVYSTLGNHDYGDYKHWNSQQEKHQNLENLKQVHADSGWRLLLNEHVAIEKDGQKIGLLGIENWGGKAGFPKYGKLDEAYAGTDIYPFKILLSHDPSHWDLQVSQDPKYKDIDLTLSGHTHGMQFGIEIPGLKWSPVQYLYKHWAGLYKQDNQHLYVNRGLGFIGYPGRVGIWPEITIIELEKA